MFLRLLSVSRIFARLSNSKLEPTPPASRTPFVKNGGAAQLVIGRTLGHLEKYRFTLEAPIETHVLAGVGLSQRSRQSRFFEVPIRDCC